MGSNWNNSPNIDGFVEEAKTYDPLLLWGILRAEILPQVSLWNLLVDKTVFRAEKEQMGYEPSDKINVMLCEFSDLVDELTKLMHTCCETAVKKEVEDAPEDVTDLKGVIYLSERLADIFGKNFQKVRMKHKDGFPDEYKQRLFAEPTSVPASDPSQSALKDEEDDDDDDKDYNEDILQVLFSDDDEEEEKPTKPKRGRKARKKATHNDSDEEDDDQDVGSDGKKKKWPKRKELNVKCPDCNKTFKNRDQRSYHKRKNACPGVPQSPKIFRYYNGKIFCIHPDCAPSGGQAREDTQLYVKKEHFFKHSIEKHFANMELTYTCKECPEKYPYSDMLQHHVKYHHDNKFTCTSCGLVLSTKANLQKHERCHTGEKPFVCDKCDFQTATASSLNYHKQRKHSDGNVKKHICDLCGKGFITGYALKMHIFTHSDVKRYSCHICGRQLKNDSCYRGHMIRVHSLKYTCDVCGKDYSAITGLNHHKRDVHGILF